MKKNIFQIVIVFVTVLALSTAVMARGKKHYKHKWWSPFGSLWNAINELQNKVSTIDDQIEAKLEEMARDGKFVTTDPDPVFDPNSTSTAETVPVICPGCSFPAGGIFENLDLDPQNVLKGAFLPGAYMDGTVLSAADLTDIDLRGATLSEVNFTNATLMGADFSWKPIMFSGNGVVSYSGATLRFVNFTGADLTNADLTGATLFKPIGLETVTWDNTTCPDGSNSDTNGDGNCLGDHLNPAMP